MKATIYTFKGALVLVYAGVIMTSSDNAYAQVTSDSKVYEINIGETAAPAALNVLAFQTQHPLLFDYDQVKSKTVNSLAGNHTLDEALTLVLQGTGLKASLNERGIVMVTLTPQGNNQQQGDIMTFTERKKKLLSGASAAIISATVAMPVIAQEAPAPDTQYDEIVVVGSRSTKPRSVLDSPVPVDVINADQLTAVGGIVDMTDTLKTFVPSYTATPLTGDGSSFVRSTSLRGLAGDQMLVLVDGKRRHRSSLVQFAAALANNGSHAADVAMIPSIALKNVQVLRDGAAAQYGSDAISGVINFELKDASEGGRISAQYGQHYEGETNYTLAANVGFGLGSKGFVNVSGEYVDNEALSRGIQRPVAQALIDAGVEGIGEDSPFSDAPFVQTWGRPESRGARFFVNSEYELGAGTLYAFGNYADVTGRTRFFYRDPNNSAITGLIANNPGQFPTNPLPAGFTPFFDGDQIDKSLVGGFKGVTGNGINYDFSIGYGSNEISYTLNNTVNPGTIAVNGAFQRDFDEGGYTQEDINVNADFSQELSDNFVLSYGAEFREEKFSINAGEPAALERGSATSGFAAPQPQSVGTNSRRNFAAYVDAEIDLSDRFFLQTAARFEDFSDFGSTINGKLAGRFDLTDNVSLRGAVSTGFHAPTPGQSNIETVLTTISTNGVGDTVLVEQGLVTPDSPVAVSVGGAPLKEETSVSLSGGIVANLGFGSLTIDGYSIDVEDRIYRTGNIGTPNGDVVSFYTNALDVRSQGIDVVYSNDFDWGPSLRTALDIAYNYGKVSVTDRAQVNGSFPVSEALVEDIETNYPNHRLNVSTNTDFGEKVSVLLRANIYGKHFDERGTIGGNVAANGAVTNASFEIPTLLSLDAEIKYNFTDQASLAFGASNLFDKYPPTIEAGGEFANRASVGLPYPRRTPFGYDGGSWYVRAAYDF